MTDICGFCGIENDDHDDFWSTFRGTSEAPECGGIAPCDDLRGAIEDASAFIAGTERMHGKLTPAGIAHFRSQGAYVRVCGDDPGCYVVRWQDERTHDRNGVSVDTGGK